jgi:SAM-dependent methyltransferase
MKTDKEKLDWRIWSKNDLVEERTYLRANGELPEMQSAIQLRNILGKIEPETSVLDVGCASGHYLRSIRQLSRDCSYTGVDATAKYIESAQEIFCEDKLAKFEVQDIYELNKSADIVFCCNVLLHLPSIKVPLTNLLNSFEERLVIRTLISEKTHLSQFLYSDVFDENDNPTDFLFQNTYSFEYLHNLVSQVDSSINVDFIEDVYDIEALQGEGDSWRKRQGFATTTIENNLQIAGDKVFRWHWMVCTR